MSISRTQFLRQSAFMLGGVALGSKLFAKNSFITKKALDTFHPKDCTWNFAETDMYSDEEIQLNGTLFYYSKDGSEPLDVQYSNENQDADINKSCTPGGGYKCSITDQNNNNPLRYVAYYPLPTIHNYDARPLPIFVIFHAGGYSDCSGIDGDGQNQTVAKAMARKGFIAISAEYRRGIRINRADIPNDNDLYPQGYTTVQQELAAYRAQQDGRGLLRSLMQRQTDDGHSGNFRFNINQFFVGGFSAGAGIANGICYYPNQSTINQVFPRGTGSPTIASALGPVQADYYYGSNTGANRPTIRGLMNCWGGLGIPTQYETNIPGFLQETVPTISFQGTQDETVWYGDGDFTVQRVFYSQASGTQPDFASENRCLLISPDYFYVKSTNLPPNENPIVTVLCTKDLHCYLKGKGVLSELYLDTSMGHGIKLNSDNFNLPSLPAPKEQTLRYIAQRAATFFQAIMNGVTGYGNTGRAEFVDCRNNRGACLYTSSSNCGNPTDQCNN